MADSSAFALHRPELLPALRRGEEKISRLFDRRLRRLAAGDTIVREEENHDYAYRLKRGWAGRVRTLPDGRSQIILVFLPGDLFAVKSMFVTRHPDVVRALSDCEIEQVDQRVLRDAFEQDSDVATRCTWQVIEEERRLHNSVVGLGRGAADERLAALFLEFRGRLVRAGVLDEKALSYELPMTQEQLGDLAGLSTVHVNRVLRAFRGNGLVVFRGRTVIINDFEALVRLAYPLFDTFEQSQPEFVAGHARVFS
ncbi:Crp/Fnr family transcriptional regulator [Ancylobacter lacus]|uniref:Crp/Fnr family transcriptional regulator n=1 Tax=Ancylobacter lacus TaxID=2579970 RepID=UPI001BCF06F2|nr:Crp/Fnr family transcriptional regulator [Ancylobacter lacus]MBS7539089.1 Crp/Fnr family transcriptional regulator [Ancylobacter lacus]